MRLRFLEDFLNHVGQDVDREWEDIEKRRTQGEFVEFTQYEDALNYPLARIDLACRTVYYELNALVESQLHELADSPWRASVDCPGPKTANDLNDATADSLKKLRLASDLPLRQVAGLVENHYGVSLSQLAGWPDFEKVRRAVNAFKHRQGLKHSREIDWSRPISSEEIRYEATWEEARTSIQGVRTLLKGLRQLEKSVG